MGRAPEGARSVIAGVRPENFEDASLVRERREEGATFRARVEVLESMGSELYAYFRLPSGGIESEELRELAEDSGTAEVPGAGDGDRVVARLDVMSEATEGEELELWIDAGKLHLFDPAERAKPRVGRGGRARGLALPR